MKRLGKLWNHKTLAVLMLLVFCVSLIPVLYLCGYVHATGDDYGYGAQPHAAWLSTHSLWEVLKADIQTVRRYWIGWQGTWFTIFLMCLQPEVFSPEAYWIVPIIMIGINVVATSLLTEYLMVRKLGVAKSSWCILNLLMLFAMLQFFPSTKSGIFWWNGTVHYIVPWSLAMMAIFAFFRYIDTFRLRYWFLALICMFCLGGSSYLAALLAPIILAYLLVLYAPKKPRSLFLLIPLAAEMGGLIVSFLSPGNTARGGEGFGFSLQRILSTVIMSFYQGIVTVGEYLAEKPALFLIFFFAAIVAWEAWYNREPRFAFPYPVLFVVLMFCTWCAMFAPGIYASVEVSGGVPNTILQTFILTGMADIVYVSGWIRRKRRKTPQEFASFRKVAYPLFLAAVAAFLVFYRGTLKETTFFNCTSYILSGQAEDYKQQMEERMEILLDDTKKEVELPEMNSEQGPLMHMEVMEDPDAWTNMVVQQFFQKDRVVRVPRK